MEKDLPRDVLEFREGDMPFSTRFGDTFYCKSDGRLECAHVFLGGNDLPERWGAGGEFTIGELGFGTGLNFLETWRQWKLHRKANASLHFVSFEAFPMQADIMKRSVSVWPEVAEEQLALAENWSRLRTQTERWQMDAQTSLTVVVADALDGVKSWVGAADAWFLDGFAPSRNADMWSLELMQAVHQRTRKGGTFASYTAAGWVRRNLAEAGFSVEKVPGYAGKRDMIRGSKL